MKFLAVACLMGAALSIRVDSGTMEEALPDGVDTENINYDTLEDQIDDQEPLKAFERAQKPEDYMYFKSPIY